MKESRVSVKSKRATANSQEKPELTLEQCERLSSVTLTHSARFSPTDTGRLWVDMLIDQGQYSGPSRVSMDQGQESV